MIAQECLYLPAWRYCHWVHETIVTRRLVPYKESSSQQEYIFLWDISSLLTLINDHASPLYLAVLSTVVLMKYHEYPSSKLSSYMVTTQLILGINLSYNKYHLLFTSPIFLPYNTHIHQSAITLCSLAAVDVPCSPFFFIWLCHNEACNTLYTS